MLVYYEEIKNTISKSNIFLKKAYLNLIDMLFPIECVVCGKEGEWACLECAGSLKFNKRNYCYGCKESSDSGEVCPECRPDYSFDGIFIAGDYEQRALKSMILSYKYGFIQDLSYALGIYLCEYYQNSFNIAGSGSLRVKKRLTFDYVVAVPLSAKRMRWRGFNQSEFLSRAVSARFGIPLVGDRLLRTRQGKPQAVRSEESRLKNIKGAFSFRGDSLKHKKILLVDDVVTTGATLNECAKILKENGAVIVWALVLAKG